MAKIPSYSGVDFNNKSVLRTTPIIQRTIENRVSTQNPPSTTPSPRGHA